MVGEIRGAQREKQWTKLELSFEIAAVVWTRASHVVLSGSDAGVAEAQ